MSENRIPYAPLFCFLERAAAKFDFVFIEQVSSMTVHLLSPLCRRTRSGLRGVTRMDGGIVLGGCSVAVKLGRSAYMDVSAGM